MYKHLWEVISSATFGLHLKFLSEEVNEIWQFCDLGGALRMCGVRDPYILNKIKKIYMGYFCTKTLHLSSLE